MYKEKWVIKAEREKMTLKKGESWDRCDMKAGGLMEAERGREKWEQEMERGMGI